MMDSQMSSDQTTLSEKLQLLQELSYSDLDMPYKGSGVHSNREIRESRTTSDIHILDVIAICLTTGEPGDVVAVAFDREQRLSLVLAKNGSPTLEDELATQNLISAITDPEVAYAMDIFHTLLSRCRVNMEKRMSNLHQSISLFVVDLDSALQEYVPKSIEDEFPDSTRFRRENYGDIAPPFRTMLQDLVRMIGDSSAVPLVPDDVELSRSRFGDLYVVAIALLRSRFLGHLCADKNLLNAAQRGRGEKLKRRLAKVCQYYGGVTKLIRNAKRYFPDGHIPYRWINNRFIGSGEGQFELCNDYLDAVQRAFGYPLSPQTVNALEQRFPDMLSNWARRRTVNTCVHAELRIILHLSSASSHPRRTVGPPEQEAIGCSKRSCFCCALWIDAYNDEFKTEWLTSGSHGKPYATWALPGPSYAHARIRSGKNVVDAAVLDGVSVRLTDTLAWLFPGQKRVSDEHVSTGESSDSEGSVEAVIDEIYSYKEFRLRGIRGGSRR
ncbi:hypothetical protein SCP_0214710 [Sparassis crispa]|uniref:Uncharacterized protein n=1 Tax=Sparassis crispa TaxID=139825 RepID=A0A401GDK0_9APHY|nr:hypothetical protein SCP_0214710 [Sparassis crispa]GBE80256.1 hypothetical protein SCP_0214710 [Sparassis crispa]